MIGLGDLQRGMVGGGRGKRKSMIVRSGSRSLIYNGEESMEVKGIFWFLGPNESVS